MSEDESPTTGGQQQNDEDFDANNSIIDKVKSRVSSIFPQTLSKWFSPTTSSSDGNRNGNLRRRRDEQLDNNEKRHQQNSDDSESDGGGSGSRNDADLILMPPSKKSRLNYNDDYPIMPPNRNLFASTPMLGGNRRKNEVLTNTEIPYNFATTSTLIGGISGGDARGIDEPRYIDSDVLDVVTGSRDWSNKKDISSRRSLNIPTPSSFVNSQSSAVHQKNSKLYQNVQINESGEQSVNLDNENDDDIGDNDDDEEDDDEKINNEIRKAQKQYLCNGLRQSIRRSDISSGGNLNNSAGRISRSGGVVIGDSASESDESQCSSVIRQRNIDKPKSGLFYPNLGTMTTNSQSGSKRTSSMANGLNFYSHLEGKKSLFSEKNMNSILNNSTLSLTSLNRRQQFNASLYGSTSALSDSRLLNTISPFYKGRTTYGGASAYNKYAQLSQQQQQRQMRVTPTLMRPTSSLSSSSNNSLIQENNSPQNINNNTNNTVISSTAKRILELMDQFTTPLNEVKKMASGIKIPLSPANKKRFSEADLIASRGIRLSKPLTPYSRPISLSQQQQPTQSGQLPPPISELHVPSMAQLLQLKRLQNNNETLREIANSSKSILNQREDYKLPNETNINNNNNSNNNNIISDNISGGKHINKMKNKITVTRQSNKYQQNDQQMSDVNLPNVQLPFMKCVPKIDIKITPPLSTTASEIIISPQSSSSSSRTSGIFNTENVINNQRNIGKYDISPRKPINQKDLINTTQKLNGDIGEFIFSSPIQVNDNQLDNKNITIESINNFKFSPPVAVDSLVDGIGNSTSNNNNLILDQNKSATMSLSFVANKNTREILSSNLLKTTSTTIIPQLKTGSVLDALKKSTTNTSTTTVISTTTQLLTSSSGFGDKFKMSSNKWECSVCMIRNDETKNKCVACETPKSSPNSTDKSISVPILTPVNQKSNFGDVFKTRSDQWECDACMVRNKNDVTECIACNTNKPGLIKSLSSTTPATITSKPLDIGFKNIVEQQTSSKWECSACMTRNDSSRTKCICCEQSKSGANTDTNTKFSFGSAAASVPTTSQFKFGFGVDSSVPKEEDLKSKTTSVSTALPTNKKTDGKEADQFVFSGQNSAKDFTPSTKALTSFSFGFKTTNESTPVIPSNTVSVSSAAAGGFKFGVAQTTTSTVNENKPISQTKTTTLLVTEKTSDNNNKLGTETTTASTMNVFNNTGFNFGVQSTSALKFPENPPSSSQKLPIENKSPSTGNNPTPGSAFKSVGGFSFGPSNTKAPITLNETKSQLFGTLATPSTAAEPLKGFVFGSTTTTSATPSSISVATTTVKKDETLKFFSGFTTPTSKIIEPVKTTAPTLQQSTFSSSNFSFGDSLKNASTNISASSATTAPVASGFGTGNPSSSFVFGAPAATSTTTPLFGVAIAPPTVNVQSPSNTIAPTPTFGSMKPIVTASNQQPKPSLFGSPNINSSNLGSTSTFGSNSNQSAIVPSAQAPTTSIFGSSFSTSTLKTPSSLESPAAAATSSAVTNQQSTGNLFSFGGGTVKNEPATTTASIPTLFGNNATSTTSLVPNSGFVFGAPKPIESTTPQSNSIFGTGMTANTSNNAAFGSTTFGSVSNTNSAFGQSQPNVNPFGTSSTNTQQLHNTGFGTPAATPSFGSSSSTSFGSSAPVQQSFGSNNTSLSFGGFGNTNSNRITGDSGDCSATKKPADTGFNFGAVGPQNTNPGFSFGSNNNNNITKPAFNFSAPAQAPTASFNFTGATEANSSQPFQFGAPSNTANIEMPLFNNYVGNESTPNTPFQFNAANNIFAPTPTPGTPSTQQGRRKIRTATRRMNPR